MRVREDVVRRRDGSLGMYGVVEKTECTLVVPQEDDGSLWLVEQFRYTIGRRAWELPQGAWPPGQAGETAQLARNELVEETGLAARAWSRLGTVHLAYGFLNQACVVYLARGLAAGEHRREHEEQDMRCARFARGEVEALIDAGELTDCATIAALHLLTRYEIAEHERERECR
jgi:8-oxo-dGTP pyrophosphatase MutT (NUDIX family)